MERGNNVFSINDIKAFLCEVDHDFPVPLSKKTDIDQLAKKYCQYATLCCEFAGDKIIAMVAGYTENTIDQMGYISLVATVKSARHKGLSSKLIKDFLRIAKEKGLRSVHVYTHSTNQNAINMYQKLGFIRYCPTVEPRPEDMHFIISLTGLESLGGVVS